MVWLFVVGTGLDYKQLPSQQKLHLRGDHMIRIDHLLRMKREDRPFSCVTCYEASFAQLLERAEVETILVGDSLGNVVQGQASTVPVTLEHMAYHVSNVARGNSHALIIGDLPFMSYSTVSQGLDSARVLMQAGAHMVKLEGGAEFAPLVRALKSAGAPVCAHLGLTPQSVNVMSGYKVQGKTSETAQKLLDDAKALEEAGAQLLVVECIPDSLGEQLSRELSIPVIGIGAGAGTDGQVLVMHDLLGVTKKPPKFSKNFLAQAGGVEAAFVQFRKEVAARDFPAREHSFGG